MEKRKVVSKNVAQPRVRSRVTVSPSTDKNPQTLAANQYGITSEDSGQLVNNSGGYQGPQISGQNATQESPCDCKNAQGEKLNSDGTVYDDWSDSETGQELEKTKGNLTHPAYTIIKNGTTYSLLKVMINPIGGNSAKLEVTRENLSRANAEELFKVTVAKEIFNK